MSPSYELQRIPFTLRLKQLKIDQQLGLFVTDSEEVILAQKQVYRRYSPFPLVPPPVSFSGVKPRNLYIQYDSPIFLMAQSITHYFIELHDQNGQLLPRLLSPRADPIILDYMIDQYELFCQKSTGFRFIPSVTSAYDHILSKHSNYTSLPSMFSRDLLKAAMVGLIRGGDVIEMVDHYTFSPKLKPTNVHTTDAPMDLFKRHFRRQKTYLSGNRCEYALVSIFRNLVLDPWKFPLDLKILHLISVPLPVSVHVPVPVLSPLARIQQDCTPPREIKEETSSNSRPKRIKVQSSSTPSASTKTCKSLRSNKSKQGTNNHHSKEVISIDSDDDEVLLVVEEEPKTVINVDAIDNSTTDTSPKNTCDTTPTLDLHPPYHRYTLYPDPIPRYTHSTFVFVRSLRKPGYILDWRIVRETDTVMTLLRPYITYVVYMKFAISFITESDLQPMEESGCKAVSLDNVIVTTADQLRLWPTIYLNDSLINFYLKWLQREHPSNDIFIFPTYFYSRVSYLEEGGVIYKDNKEQRGKLWNDLKGWTKGIDIFSKSFVLFPINSQKHWSFVLLCYPGHFLRLPFNKGSKNKKQMEVHTLIDDDCKIPTVSNESILMHLSSLDETTNSTEHKTMDTDAAIVGEGKTETRDNDSAITVEDLTCVENEAAGTRQDESVIDLNDAVDVDESMESQCPTDDTMSSGLAPCIIHFDSGKRFKSHSASVLFKNIRKYIQACYEATKAEQYPGRVVDGTSIPGLTPDLPQQENAEDCGVYMLEFMERLLINPSSIDCMSIAEMKKRTGKLPLNFWFSNTVPADKREAMYALLDALAQRQQEAPVMNG